MSQSINHLPRRVFLAGLAAGSLAIPISARAQILGGTGLGSGLSSLLGKASDSSLDKLSAPGAYYNDPAIRIMLPLLGGAGGTLGKLLGGADKLGLTDGITRKLNDAAGFAALQAKPVFRAAISKLSLNDVPGIVSQSNGATQYLRQSAGGELRGKFRPLIDAALTKVGAFRAIDSLAKRSPLLGLTGITRDKLGLSVTDQALNGVFSYIGAEEGRLRDNPLGAAGGLLKGILGN